MRNRSATSADVTRADRALFTLRYSAGTRVKRHPSAPSEGSANSLFRNILPVSRLNLRFYEHESLSRTPQVVYLQDFEQYSNKKMHAPHNTNSTSKSFNWRILCVNSLYAIFCGELGDPAVANSFRKRILQNPSQKKYSRGIGKLSPCFLSFAASSNKGSAH